jgi:hypothetical protein
MERYAKLVGTDRIFQHTIPLAVFWDAQSRSTIPYTIGGRNITMMSSRSLVQLIMAAFSLSCSCYAFQKWFPTNSQGQRSISLSKLNNLPKMKSNVTESTIDGEGLKLAASSSLQRRSLLLWMGLASSFGFSVQEVSAALQFGGRSKQSSLFFVSPDTNASDSLQREQVVLDPYALNSELCLLKLLPVKNQVFRGLENTIVGLSVLKSATCKCYLIEDFAKEVWNKNFRFLLAKRSIAD